MELSKLKEILKGYVKEEDVSRIAVDIHTDYSGEITTEIEKGKSEYRKKDDEVMRYKSAAKEHGYDKETHGDFKTFIGTIVAKADKSTETMTDLEKVTGMLTELKSEVVGLKDVNTGLKIKSNSNFIKAQLTTPLNEKLYGAKYLVNDLINTKRVIVDENDDKVYGLKGEERIPIDKFMETIIEENKADIKSSQSGGSGGGGGDNENSGNKSIDLMSEAATVADVREAAKKHGIDL